MRNLLYCVNTYIYYINGTCSNELCSHCCDLIGWAALPRGRYALPSMCRCTEHVYSFVPETIHATHQFTCVCSLAWKCRTTNAVIVGTASKGMCKSWLCQSVENCAVFLYTWLNREVNYQTFCMISLATDYIYFKIC